MGSIDGFIASAHGANIEDKMDLLGKAVGKIQAASSRLPPYKKIGYLPSIHEYVEFLSANDMKFTPCTNLARDFEQLAASRDDLYVSDTSKSSRAPDVSDTSHASGRVSPDWRTRVDTACSDRAADYPSH